MPRVIAFGVPVRSNGRILSAVRRPKPALAVSPDLKKAELVALAEQRGLDTSGTKAELSARLTESNDATVKPDA